MTKKTTDEIKQDVIKAALGLARFKGWENTSLGDIAAQAGITLATLHEHFDERSDILAAYSRMIDKRLLENDQTQNPESAPAHDRLFDIFMDRFDMLNEDRDALCAILGSFPKDPKQALISLPHLTRSMNWMMEAASLNTNGIKGAAKLTVLTLVYIKTLWVWTNDESPDLAKTMAALDQNLERTERWGRMAGFIR